MDPQDTCVVETMALTKVFRDFWLREKVTAVADLSIKVMPREVFGLLGPNGSGKSTTLKMILGLLFPSRGRITVFGKRPTDVRTKSRIGFLPEDTYLYPFLDARETLDYYGRLFHLPRAERRRRIDMLLDMVELSAVSYRRVAEYSKGMQRRIGLAQALINDPDLLILDEPTSGLDPIGTRQFKDLIRTLARRGKTVILSSHLLADVEDVCDRVCVLYAGRQRALGSVGELLTQHGQTQIVTEQLDEPTLERLYAVLDEARKDVIEVSSPREKLESMFLRIVKEAQGQRPAAAVDTGRVAEFLRGPTAPGREVVEELLRAGRDEQQPQPPATEARPAEAARAPAEAAPAEPAEAPAAEAPPEAPAAEPAEAPAAGPPEPAVAEQAAAAPPEAEAAPAGMSGLVSEEAPPARRARVPDAASQDVIEDLIGAEEGLVDQEQAEAPPEPPPPPPQDQADRGLIDELLGADEPGDKPPAPDEKDAAERDRPADEER
jgi:ABC-2 type transport system ATP-binding protein